ncbi:uncharacterized protein PODANS_7_9680 [Podospora anserina S mat+]|uniref:Podospora anserina S mat+ genomic DNA chromosome 7, supercontig 1 n=1 Tax=Podospora anserina (strain S / ATCC MYA-4624 / DSM 980 / FGSC 10383) TaxID=515849 RepID=B2AX87_PODAN|nr:uncharacterized protein PODANS_7_9680 [Podospora anserina S mat+]CAP69011.1 unnamed protein product [Podospora anserina S mat+]
MQSPYPTRWSSSRLYPTAVPVPVLAAPGLQGRALRTRRHLEVYALLDPHPLWPVSSGRPVIAGSVVGLMSVSLLLLVRVYMLMFAGSVLAILLETSPCRPGFRLYGAGSTSWCCWSRPSEYRAVCNWHRDNGFCASWA